jgi:hypothetical protein
MRALPWGDPPCTRPASFVPRTNKIHHHRPPSSSRHRGDLLLPPRLHPSRWGDPLTPMNACPVPRHWDACDTFLVSICCMRCLNCCLWCFFWTLCKCHCLVNWVNATRCHCLWVCEAYDLVNWSTLLSWNYIAISFHLQVFELAISLVSIYTVSERPC